LLSERNERRRSAGEPPFAHVLESLHSAVIVACPYCFGKHRHPWTRIGDHLEERCKESKLEWRIGYIAVDALELRLTMAEEDQAKKEGWIPLGQLSLFTDAQ
jgi:hypothetical protein